LDKNWCNRNANNGLPVSGCRADDPASSVARIARSPSSTVVPVSDARWAAASRTFTGSSRMIRPVSSVAKPNLDSIHVASGEFASAA
jgi:hypothetical protein